MKFNINILKKVGGTALLSLTAVAVAAGAFAATYSTEDDPLISLSYINEILIPDIKSYIEERFAQENIDSAPVVAYPATASSTYEVVALSQGEQLFAEGCLEIILRSGNAIALSPFTDQGIGNMVTGEEYLDGDFLTKNNYCIIPRGDRRGVRAESEICYFLVRGEYIIQ